jgi:hypothetical protein
MEYTHKLGEVWDSMQKEIIMDCDRDTKLQSDEMDW